jgi:hypothetical protein
MATPRVFPFCQTQNYAILLNGQTCNAYSSKPWRADSTTFKSLSPPPPPPLIRLPQRLSVYISGYNPPTLGLASQLINFGKRLRGFPYQRSQIMPRI